MPHHEQPGARTGVCTHLAGGLHDGRERGVGAGLALGIERVEANACLSRRVHARTLREASTMGASAGSGRAFALMPHHE